MGAPEVAGVQCNLLASPSVTVNNRIHPIPLENERPIIPRRNDNAAHLITQATAVLFQPLSLPLPQGHNPVAGRQRQFVKACDDLGNKTSFGDQPRSYESFGIKIHGPPVDLSSPARGPFREPRGNAQQRRIRQDDTAVPANQGHQH